MSTKIYILLLFFALAGKGTAQSRSDTAALIKDFNKVVSFAVQPYVYCSSITSIHGVPSFRMADSGILHSTFYKLNDDLYYGNEHEEVYVQDSFMIRINHTRKAILVSKVDVLTKGSLDVLPLKRADAQKMLREHYSISQIPSGGDTGQIIMQSQEKRTAQGISSEKMQVTYTKSGYLPSLMEITLYTRQPVSEQLVSALSRQGIDAQSIVQQRDGASYLVMSQTASIHFIGIEATKEKAMQMPLWKERIVFDNVKQTFIGKDSCEGYEITKTF